MSAPASGGAHGGEHVVRVPRHARQLRVVVLVVVFPFVVLPSLPLVAGGPRPRAHPGCGQRVPDELSKPRLAARIAIDTVSESARLSEKKQSQSTNAACFSVCVCACVSRTCRSLDTRRSPWRMRACMCMRGDADGEKNGTDRQSGVKRERKEKEKERKTGMWSETEKQSLESA